MNDSNKIEKVSKALGTYKSPEEFNRLRRSTGRVESADLFNQGKYKPLLEARIAVGLAIALQGKCGPIKLKMISQDEQFPDFKILMNSTEHDFEITEVMEPERRRGDEYGGKRKRRLAGENEEVKLVGHLFEEGGRLGAEWIANGIERKIKKHYSIKVNLAVYANFPFYELYPEEIAAKCKRYEASFKSIWVVRDKSWLQLFDSNDFGPTDLLWHQFNLEQLR